VDLDGTLTYADTLHEGVVNLMHRSPLSLVALVQALWDGKAAVKQSVASQTVFDPSLLPYDPALLAYLRAEHEAGRQIGLFTAADQSIADAVADHLGLFSVARGSDGVTNLRGEAKTAAIEAAFGPSFAYAGNSAADLPILTRAESAILAGPVERLRAALGGKVPVEAEFPHSRASLGTWARALRLPHWAKNSLVFVGPILAGQPAAMLGPASTAGGELPQLVDGFGSIVRFKTDYHQYPDYRGAGTQAWSVAVRDHGSDLVWQSSPCPEQASTVVAFNASTSDEQGDFELYVNGTDALTFHVGPGSDMRSASRGDYAFTFVPKAHVAGNAGIVLLSVPAAQITPGQPLEIRVVPKSGDPAAWFMVQSYPDTVAIEHLTPELAYAAVHDPWTN